MKASHGSIYYILESKLTAGVYKLGITSNLTRRLNQHGGRDKHSVVWSGDLGRGTAYKFEQRIKQQFHHRRITDGNELFALEPSELAQILADARSLAELIKAKRLQKKQAPSDLLAYEPPKWMWLQLLGGMAAVVGFFVAWAAWPALPALLLIVWIMRALGKTPEHS